MDPGLLLQLPAELRDQVYDYLVISVQQRVPVAWPDMYYITVGLATRFLQEASPQIRAEAIDRLRHPYSHHPAATLILDLAHVSSGHDLPVATWFLFDVVLECIQVHMEADRARLFIESDAAVTIHSALDENHSYWEMWDYPVPNPAKFDSFLGCMVMHSRRTNAINIRVKIDNYPLREVIRALSNLLSSGGSPTLLVTLCVPGGSVEAAWREALQDRLAHPNRIRWRWWNDVAIELEVGPDWRHRTGIISGMLWLLLSSLALDIWMLTLL
jgi:hypothetical protein